MHLLRNAILVVCGVIGFAALDGTRPVSAQLQIPPARAPCSVLGGRPCHPSFCGVYHRGPCFPDYLPPIGQDLRLTIVSTDADDPASKPAGDQNKTAGDEALDSIAALYAALRACWTPPPQDEERQGREYTVRFAFKRDGEIVAPPRVTYASHDSPADVRDIY